MATNNETITPQVVEDINPEILERVGEVISKIEESKQQTALAQIKAVSEDNERQFEFAKLQSEISKDKWNKSFLVGVSAAIALGGTGLYLLINDNTALGIGLLSNTFTGVFAYLAGVGANK